jgi:thioredoxin reductase
MPPEEEQVEQLAARWIQIIDGEVSSLDVDDCHLAGVRLLDGTVIERDALVVSTRLTARASFLSDLGLTPTEHPSGLGEHIKVDSTGQTEVPGVWAAGNLTDPAAQVGGSAAAAALAAIRINAALGRGRHSSGVGESSKSKGEGPSAMNDIGVS